MNRGILRIAAIAATAVISLTSLAQAQTLNWDPNITGGSAQGGTGTWNNSNVNWAVLSTSTDQTWTSGDTAVFDGAIAGAVSLTKSESANNLVFNTSGYTISGNNQLTLSGGSVSVVPGGSATISSPLGLTPGANWYSTGGTLTLGGALVPSTSSTLNILSGTLNLAETGTQNFPNGGTINGNLVISTSIRVNFNSLVGSTSAALPTVATYGGTGTIQIQAPGSILSNTSGTFGGAIGAPGGGLQLQLNSLNLPFNKFDVTASTPAYPATNSFATAIGATKNGNFNGYLQINAPISGNSDVVFTSNSTAGGGAGVTLLNSQCTYTGTTLIEGNGGTTTGYNGGSLILGTSNALPVGTDVEFGDLNGKPSHNPVIDLNGNSQTIGSLSSNAASVTYSSSDNFYIANNNAGTVATLTVSGSTTPFNSYGGFLTDNTTGSGGTLALAKAGPNTLVLTNTNTYSGGTTLNGGTLVVANSAGSATGSGPITLDAGTLASGGIGSVAGNVSAGSGPETIAPGGLSGIGTLIVGGSVSLNGNSTLNFDISSSLSSLLEISGALSTTSPVDVDINASGTLSGTYPLAIYANSAINLADFNATGVPAGYTLQATATQLSIAPVPEPSTIVLLVAGAVGLLCHARRRRLT